MATPEEMHAALEQKGIKYAIAAQAHESIHTYLKYWSALMAAILTICGWYGLSVKQTSDRIDATLQSQADRLIQIQRQTTTLTDGARARQNELNERFKALNDASRELNNTTRTVTNDANTLARTAVDFTGQLNTKLQLADDYIKTADHSRSELDNQLVTMSRRLAETEGMVSSIRDVSNHAREFDHDINMHATVFRTALLDHMTLHSNSASPHMELAAADGVHKYIVWFEMPEIKRQAFDIKYKVVVRDRSVNEGEPINEATEIVLSGVGTIVPKERKWNVMDFADREYQFAGDFVFNSHFARDFVNIRVAATDKLLRRFNRSENIGGLD